MWQMQNGLHSHCFVPSNYWLAQHSTPVTVFIHLASVCGQDMFPITGSTQSCGYELSGQSTPKK